jgi:glutamyl-tRNA synthetase
MLETTAAALAAVPAEAWSAEAVESAVRDAAMVAGYVNAEGNPQLAKAQAPIRVAVTGRSVGPPLWQSIAVLGREASVTRLEAARARLP